MQAIICLTLCLSLVASHQAMAQSHFDFYQPIQPPRKIQVMVHRGMTIAAPENSATAITMCAQDYCEWAEIDVRLSKDGFHVIIHNETVDATSDGTGKVAALTLQELKKLDAGSWFAKRFASGRMLTLTEALELAKGKINLYLDCKNINPKGLVKEVIAAGMERQVIVFGSSEDLIQVQSAAPGKIACMAKFRPKSMTLDEFVAKIKPSAVEIDADEINSAMSEKFHAIGIKVQVKVLGKDWDNATFWAKAIDAGADWLQTDDPAGLLFFNARRTVGKFPVKIAAHRGANRYAPENTLPAILEAARLGLDYAEIDIRTTLDGKQVLMHDSSLNRRPMGKEPCEKRSSRKRKLLSLVTVSASDSGIRVFRCSRTVYERLEKP